MRDAMTSRRQQLGLSLVELMVSITLGLLILSGVLVVFVNTSAARSEVERTSRQIENGRYASELLSEDLRLAGFYGELSPGSLGIPGAMPADPCSIQATDWNAWIPIHLQGFDDAGFASPNCTLTNLKANTDVLVVRRARACAAGVAGCDAAVPGKPYVQVSLCAAQVLPSYKLGLEGTETFDMQKRTCLTTALANKREYLVRIYFISTDNGAGQNIPTLKRLELTGSGWSTVPLVEGIEELQLHYGIDHTCDGQPDVYVANPATFIAPPPPPPPAPPCGTTPIDNWMNVVTVQFHLLARNLETSPGYSEGIKKYILGKKADGNNFEVTPGDAYRRHVYSGLVRVANAAGRRDTP
jgi:type IV pilus assembly protein PilW